MKKIILGIVFVFATVSLTNAKVVEDSLHNNYSKSESVESLLYEDCMADAWRYGTENGGGDPREEYDMTLLFYELFCE
ncbi:MAG: hypothetical protein ACOH1N_05085 [Lutibacter sp.]